MSATLQTPVTKTVETIVNKLSTAFDDMAKTVCPPRQSPMGRSTRYVGLSITAKSLTESPEHGVYTTHAEYRREVASLRAEWSYALHVRGHNLNEFLNTKGLSYNQCGIIIPPLKLETKLPPFDAANLVHVGKPEIPDCEFYKIFFMFAPEFFYQNQVLPASPAWSLRRTDATWGRTLAETCLALEEKAQIIENSVVIGNYTRGHNQNVVARAIYPTHLVDKVTFSEMATALDIIEANYDAKRVK